MSKATTSASIAMAGLPMGSDGVAWYGVRTGHNPGVYNEWHQCLAQTAGYRGAHYDVFHSRESAQAFVDRRLPVENFAPTGSSFSMPIFWGVVGDDFTGVTMDSDAIKKRFSRDINHSYKSFSTRREAEDYVNERTGVASVPRNPASGPDFTPASIPDVIQPRDDDMADADDGADYSQSLGENLEAVGIAADNGPAKSRDLPDGMIEVYTDGSSSMMSHPAKDKPQFRVGGLGVYFGPDDERNLAEPVEGPIGYYGTNQRAELSAVLRALESVPRDQGLLIWTDSKYAIQSVTEFHKDYEANGWVTSTGKPVYHQDLIKKIILKVRERPSEKTVFRWCKGHAGTEGNEAADKLAAKGAQIAYRNRLEQL